MENKKAVYERPIALGLNPTGFRENPVSYVSKNDKTLVAPCDACDVCNACEVCNACNECG